ncbi:C-X-C chemokine receptor type 6 [Rhinatrema bivittatum]|uniref:C-X-C chemokine receptor type 6 n=1 Tax=Rhinatrema bivittatum TaxID=194408 RepID=UPI0011294838|nr:C-X-C chemokine receptor type 6 [Rhinatrema bivittatum]XP_029445525.1 C-X-C chemokine receptor type 6 [Rhinatrema bivittatum]
MEYYDKSDFADSVYLDYVNSTLDPNEHNVSQALHNIFLPCIYSFTCIFGLMGNSLVVLIYIFYEKLKTLMDVFLVNLATADILFLCTLPFLAYDAAHQWIFGLVMCKLLRGLYTVNLYTSMLTLTCITVDRYIAIARATRVHRFQGKKLAFGIAVCVTVWVVSFAIATPQFIFNKQFTISNQLKCYAEYNPPHVQLIVNGFQMTFGFFIPLLTMIVCYAIIINIIIHAKGIRKYKSLKIIFMVVAVFIATQLPYNLVILISTTDPNIHMHPHFIYAVTITEAIAYFHGCLNPVLYFFIGVKFRKNFVRLLKDFRCAGPHAVTKPLKTSDAECSKTFSASTNAEAISMHPI